MIEKIITSKAINSSAAKVTSKGIHYDPHYKINEGSEVCSDLPLPIIKTPRNFYICGIGNLTGKTNGRMDCLGFFGKKRWVVRCKCGNYTLRSTNTIQNWSEKDCCIKCKTFEVRKYYYNCNKDLNIKDCFNNLPDPEMIIK